VAVFAAVVVAVEVAVFVAVVAVEVAVVVAVEVVVFAAVVAVVDAVFVAVVVAVGAVDVAVFVAVVAVLTTGAVTAWTVEASGVAEVADWTVEVTPPTRSAEAVAGAAKHAMTRPTRRAMERVARRGRPDRWSGG
jgi:hypothetical protein